MRAQVKFCHDQFTEKIRKSQALSELDAIFEKNKLVFDTKSGEGFDDHKDQFDAKIKKYRFASIIKRKPFYDELISKIDSTRENMSELFDSIKSL